MSLGGWAQDPRFRVWPKAQSFLKDFNSKNDFGELGPGPQIQDLAKKSIFLKRILIEKMILGSWAQDRQQLEKNRPAHRSEGRKGREGNNGSNGSKRKKEGRGSNSKIGCEFATESEVGSEDGGQGEQGQAAGTDSCQQQQGQTAACSSRDRQQLEKKTNSRTWPPWLMYGNQFC